MQEHRYLIALGSNMRVPGIGSPRAALAAAIEALRDLGIDILVVSPAVASAPVGPSMRRYVNAAAMIESKLEPPELLRILQAVENAFGRRRRGAAWRSRPLDLDIILWSGGYWADDELVIPHRHFRARSFVLGPAAKIAPDWRDPLTGLTLRQLAARGA